MTTMFKRASFIEWDRSDQVPKAIQDLYPLAKDTKIMLGVVWPDKHVAFPDFSDNRTIQWWKNEIKRFHDQVRLVTSSVDCIQI
ncbi:unnamed protein product [Anisakis simplex]|uniref:TIR domain-containing protein n=1 Tax=Anisakis simplex TaxID=6269 RepID=A0A0M3JD57_ANISI|nr:unnamed protein product [Anisakis simplex]